MSLEELHSDGQAVQAKIDSLISTMAPELVSILRNDIVPLILAGHKEMAEIDEAVSDMYSESEDILQPNTAGLFAALIATGRPLVTALAKILKDRDPKAAAKCDAWLEVAKVCEQTLEEITVPDHDGDDDEEDDEEDDEDDKEETGKPALAVVKEEK